MIRRINESTTIGTWTKDYDTGHGEGPVMTYSHPDFGNAIIGTINLPDDQFSTFGAQIYNNIEDDDMNDEIIEFETLREAKSYIEKWFKYNAYKYCAKKYTSQYKY